MSKAMNFNLRFHKPSENHQVIFIPTCSVQPKCKSIYISYITKYKLYSIAYFSLFIKRDSFHNFQVPEALFH